MGTTLTGTTPQDTYDSLIKVTDNGPLSGSLKTLTDGLGNDSALALSTGAASITGTLAATAGANFATSSGNVGIGTGSPSYKLDTRGTAAVFNAGLDGITAPTLYLGHPSYTTTYLNKISTSVSAAPNSQVMQFSVANGASTYADVMTLNGAGNVGIGTSSPEGKLEILGGTDTTNTIVVGDTDNATIASDHSIVFNVDRNLAVGGRVVEFRYGGNGYSGGTSVAKFTSAGLCFGSDSLAANALDDYEEGTWTPTTASDPTGAFSGTTGEYTKIGNVVHFRIVVAISSNFADNFVGGLPFTVGGSSSVSAFSGAFNVANENFPDIIATTIAGQSYIRFYTNNDTNNQAQPATTWGTLRIFGSYRV